MNDLFPNIFFFHKYFKNIKILIALTDSEYFSPREVAANSGFKMLQNVFNLS